MKVIRIVRPSPHCTEEVVGQFLCAHNQPAVFVPDREPYGPNRLTIHEPIIGIYGPEDDNCINVSGLVEAGRDPATHEQLWRKVTMEPFYPALSP